MRRLIFVLGMAAGIAAAQDATPPGTVIRINVNLVQVDAVVSDSKNHHVGNLKAGDFEILQDGKPQAISNFSYIAGSPKAAPSAPVVQPRRNGAPAPPPPPVMLKPTEARRFFALVVDDLGLSFESMAHVRDALRQFVNHQMQPGDMAAILRTSAGMGVFQQFTTDHALLQAAIDHIKFTMGRVGVDSFAVAGQITDPNLVSPAGPSLAEDLAPSNEAAIGQVTNEVYLSGTLGALRYVIDGLRDMPGRKAVVVFSESMQLFTGAGADPVPMFGAGPTLVPDTMMFDQTRRLIDAANRASVVIYTIDPRGVQSLFPNAADNPIITSPQTAIAAVAGVMQQRETQMFDSQEGLSMLALETGGLFVQGDNFLDQALRDVVADTEGYYLIGYHPNSDTFDSKTGQPKFHNVQVRLKVAGLHVRSRSGFFGESDAETPDAPHTGQGDLLHALTSPFAGGDINVQLTALFHQHPGTAPFLAGLLYIDAKDLKFTAQPDGSRKAVLEVAAATFGESGRPVDESTRRFEIDMTPEQLTAVQANGLVYEMNQPLKRPGPYQLRVALRDQDSGQLGSASQFIQVPDVGKGSLALSSIMLRNDPGPSAREVVQAEGQVSDDNASAALRVFQPGAALSYQYAIFNPRTNPSKKTNLEVRTRLFRDGKLVYDGQPMVPELTGQPSAKQVQAGGNMVLAKAIPPGDYVLQVIVTDKPPGQKPRMAWQWTDFEVK